MYVGKASNANPTSSYLHDKVGPTLSCKYGIGSYYLYLRYECLVLESFLTCSYMDGHLGSVI